MLESKEIVKYLLNIVAHGMFWVLVYFFFNYFLGYGSANTEYVNKFSMYLMPITIVISYFFFFFLIPKYLLKKEHGLFILYSIYTIVISIFLIVLSILYATLFLIHLKPENTSPITKTLPFIILGVYFVVLVVISIGLFIYNYKSVVKNDDLKNKILQTQLQLKEQELRLLKMQIHPHFLFNSLNTIYGYALKKEDQAPEMILKLSNLLDYILYQIEKPRVLLTNELNHIEDYIALEKIRFHDTLLVEFNQENVSDDIMIAPMLLIPFVENSFKHGAIIKGTLQVDISIQISNDLLIFQIENTAFENSENGKGIGLENIQKRLEMLYPNAYKLKTSLENQKFKVNLEIEMKGLKNNEDVDKN